MGLTEQTIDPEEVAYYQRMADQWWDKSGSFWPLHRLNELRVVYLLREICLHFGRSPGQELPLRGVAIVDIGCGGGILSESMAKLGATVHGIDVVEKNINVARHHGMKNHLAIDYSLVTAEDLAASGVEYDVVLNMEVIEHVADLPTFMSQCARLLRADGIMFVATLNRSFLSWMFAIVGAEYILGWLPRGTHDWRKFVQPDELTQLFANNGLAPRASAGVRINPFNRNFSLSDRLTVNYMMSAVRAS